jgi:hypothetical protein
MKRRVGLLLALTVVVAAGTLFQNYRFDVAAQRERDAAQTLDRALTALDVALADLRAAQAGYVATGQGAASWMNEVATLAGRIRSDVEAARARTIVDAARTRYDRALTALDDFGNIDSRARRYVDDEQLLFASDLVFMDAPEAGRRASNELASAREAEAAAGSERLARLRWLRFGMNGLALAFLLLVAVASVRGRLASERVTEAGAMEATKAGREPEETPAAGDRTDEEGPARTLVPPPPPTPPPPAPAFELAPTAELCGDLARLVDGRDLPALVERTAAVLGAKGVVLWTIDGSGAMLRPALAHGYSERVLARLGSLQVDAENVTSLAFRSMRPQVMNGSAADAPGALAVPLVTPSGCVGVLSAETRRTRPGDELMALARILGAQFSTVITPAAEADRQAAGE